MPRAPFGTWPSTIQAEDLVSGSTGVGFPVQAGDRVLWQEVRAHEGGRVAIVSLSPDGAERDVLPVEMSARTSVHEYGGLCWAVGGPGGNVVVSVNQEDQRLWRAQPGPPRPLTPAPSEPGSLRYGTPMISADGRTVVVVREAHSGASVVNDIVVMPTGAGPREGPQVAAVPAHTPPAPPVVVASGHDFFSWPVFSPDGRQLAYIAWDMPAMPWDGTSLWVCSLDGSHASAHTKVAGSPDVSVLQPKWCAEAGQASPVLAWISDANGWWVPYLCGVPMCGEQADFAGAPWSLGDSNYAQLTGGTVVATWRTGGRSYLGTIVDGDAVAMDLPFTEFSSLSPYTHSSGGLLPGAQGVLAVAAGPDEPAQLIAVSGSGEWSVLRRSRPEPENRDDISVGEHFCFPTTGGDQAHAIFYPPRLSGWQGLEAELPPLIVTSHGGPTGQASTAYEPRTQFWTRRGFAVVDVDYRGSTGYGRSYRRALQGHWGVADVDDCVAAVRWLGDQALADSRRAVVRGSSSSGLTVLAALARYPWLRGGIVRYPVCDISDMASSHKFESRYLERLVPPDQVTARSPVTFAAAIKAPVLFMHGSDDRVVPCASTLRAVEAMRAGGAAPGLVVLEGEGHGFRQSPNVARSLSLELAFVCDLLGLEAAVAGQAQADLRECREPGGAFWACASPR
ncbi:MAG TPA: prolyl oligopeptidase family serine peptidase [Acidimicrobiales bacterium]|nr:prolyl oligopeptidase family serine peptidase [Acidimicrobiales bacterium]